MNEQEVKTLAHLDGARMRRSHPNRNYIEVSHLCVDEMCKQPVPTEFIETYRVAFFEGYCAPQRIEDIMVRGIEDGRPYIIASKRIRGTYLEAENWGQEQAKGNSTAWIDMDTPINNLLIPGIEWENGNPKNTIIS